MRLVDAVGKAVSKLYSEKKMLGDMQKVKEKSGLQEQDWRVFIEQKYKYPAEVQTVVEAPNEEHVKLYDKDLAEVNRIAKETGELIRKEIPECVHINWLDGTLELHTQREMVIMASQSGQTGADTNCLSTNLYYAAPYLYGSNVDVDINLEAQVLYNSFMDLEDDSKKNVRIAQKGKTGEDYVSGVLNQYRNKFFVLENVVIPAYEEKGKTSETDVYIITSKGIFVCEVKNYGSMGQTLYIPEHGVWPLYNSSGHLLSEKPSAFEQNARHCNATRSFIKEHLGIEVPIIPVVIIANDVVDVRMENPNSNIVIRANQIYELVSEFQDVLSYETQKKITETFEKHQLDANDFPVKINADKANYAKNLIKEYIPYMKVNAELADIYKKSRKQSSMISWGIIGLLAALCLWYAFEDSMFAGVWGVVLIGISCIADTAISWICGIVALIALLSVLAGGSFLLLLVVIAGTALMIFTMKKNEERIEP
ncbi:MAG: NERD domain-containing protein [Lachnospiraceae bacterium]|nr:NERD domain-containing protein [Lachnospiraceae bacterium]